MMKTFLYYLLFFAFAFVFCVFLLFDLHSDGFGVMGLHCCTFSATILMLSFTVYHDVV